MLSARYSSQILMTLEFSQQVFENSSNIEFCANPSSASRVVHADRHMTRLTAAFRNFSNAPKNQIECDSLWQNFWTSEA
jgi:hypothetical protein